MSEAGAGESSVLPIDPEALERIAGDPTAAFEERVLETAARYDVGTVQFQAMLSRLRACKVSIGDWRVAVKRRRDAKLKAKREEHERGPVSSAEQGDEIADVAEALLKDRTTGEPRKNLANLSTILARDPRWRDVVAYHELREAIVITAAPPWHPDDAPPLAEQGEWSEQDTARATAWFARVWSIDVPSSLVLEAVDMQAHKRTINPLTNYLGSLRWDGVDRLDTWLAVYLGASQSPYTAAIGRRWMISAAARAFKPGCKVDCVLVLEGLQGKGKSTALQTLAVADEFFFDGDLEIGNKEAAQSLRGKWITELGELSALSRHELQAVKAFLTRKVDSYRASYARRAKDWPRRCVFAGSTNDEEYLKDEENRRFWPVKTGNIDLVALREDRDQLWAEAVHRFLSHEPWHVDTPELADLCRVEQELRAQADPWEKWIGDWLSEQLASKPCEARIIGDLCACMRCHGTTTAQVLSGALSIERGKQGRAEETRAGTILRRMGWTKGVPSMRAGLRVRPYFPPT